jgi:OmpA-OmpF porin, OOP family
MLFHIMKENIMLKKHLLAIAALTSVTAAVSVQAEEFQDNRWYVSPYGSFIHTGGDRQSSDGWGGGMGIGKILNKHFNVELKGSYHEFSGTNGPWSLAGGTADLQYYFTRGTFSPYTVIGVGAQNTCASANCGIGLLGEAGVGFTYELHDNLLIRSDVRYRYNNNLNAHVQPGTDEFHDMVVNVGFVIPFGDKPTAAKAEEPAVVETPVAPADCSTLDSDADGVNDCNDQCAGTMAGSKVNEQGCPITLELKGVNFKVDSAELTINAKSILDGVAENLINYPQKNDIEVAGHTSSEGSNAHNLKLSQRRSQSVVNYLKRKGVSNKLYAKGYGENHPVADNSTEEGRMQNRRVELIWKD